MIDLVGNLVGLGERVLFIYQPEWAADLRFGTVVGATQQTVTVRPDDGAAPVVIGSGRQLFRIDQGWDQYFV